MTKATSSIFTINTGSSSLKAALYRVGDRTSVLRRRASVERIGSTSTATVRMTDEGGAIISTTTPELRDHAAALQFVLQELLRESIDAIGHRVVHGGSRFSQPERVSSEVISGLRALVPVDPTHLPQAIAAIEVVTKLRPHVPQVACFDTAFHRSMPPVAQRYPLPRDLAAAGVIRYGFHGLSYEYIVEQLRASDPAHAGGRAVLAHLGNGASMAAVHDGRAIDTTMGFSPTGGLMMGTRSGDLDPGVLIYLADARGMGSAELSELFNRRSGLLGVSGRSSDMRDLLAAEVSDAGAAEAVELFCYQARKYLGALAAVLGGLDTLVFTGGIGEHAPSVRERICRDLEFLSVRLDLTRNATDSTVISAEGSPVTVRVIATDEDVMIARHTYDLLQQRGASHVPL
jgi:acetate kinase